MNSPQASKILLFLSVMTAALIFTLTITESRDKFMGTATGRFVNKANGRACVGTTVYLLSLGGDAPPYTILRRYSTKTGADGRWSIMELPAGRYCPSVWMTPNAVSNIRIINEKNQIVDFGKLAIVSDFCKEKR